jgi:hypothetical protein
MWSNTSELYVRRCAVRYTEIMSYNYSVVVYDGESVHRLSMRGHEALLKRIHGVVDGEVEVCYETPDFVTLTLDRHDTPAGLDMSLQYENEVTVTWRRHPETDTDEELESSGTGFFLSDSDIEEELNRGDHTAHIFSSCNKALSVHKTLTTPVRSRPPATHGWRSLACHFFQRRCALGYGNLRIKIASFRLGCPNDRH